MADNGDTLPPLERAQRRLLRRIYNGRTTPVTVADRSFLTYKDAVTFLQSLTPEARDAAYAEMKANAKGDSA